MKVGRYTAAILLVTVGVLLLLDQTTGSRHLGLLLQWWPVVLIMLGLEYIIFSAAVRSSERQLRLDVSGLLLSVLFSAVVVGTTQADRVPSDWLKDLNFNIDTLQMSFSSESGYSFEKEAVKIPISAETGMVRIENPNGTLLLQAGAVTEIEVGATVWVDKVDEAEAKDIAAKSTVQSASEGGALRIKAEGYEYTGGFTNKRKPRMNLTVTVPASLLADYEAELKNGKIEANGLKLKRELKLHTTNGAVAVSDIAGSVSADTTNGAVEAARIQGAVEVDTTNGAVTVKAASGAVKVDTTNGAVTVEEAKGLVDVDTTNGKIIVREAEAGVKAEATNGSISVASHQVGGSYELKNMNGSIEVLIPADASLSVKGSARGAVTTNLPLTVENKKLSGQLGSGQYTLKADTNSRLEVNKID